MFLSAIFQAIRSFFGFSNKTSSPKSSSKPSTSSKPKVSTDSSKPKVSTESSKGNNVRKTIPKRTRNEVWIKYCGEKDHGNCYVCRKRVERYNKGWDCSHVIADAKGGLPVLENLRVCCPKCNRSMGTMNLYEYKCKYQTK